MSAELAVDARPGAFAGLWAWLDDRVNPILIKEVRQALRGRYFRNMFWLTVVGATIISLYTILQFDPNVFTDRLGVAFFLANYGVMVVAINAFVPFWAFQSMSGEWEENTYDLLVISNLRPRQLLLGKALAAGVQSFLFFAAFAPYLVSTFLMGGVDLVSVVIVLCGTVMLSLCLSISAIALASFGRSRIVRAILAVAFIGALLGLVAAAVGVGSALIQRPETIRDSEFLLVVGVFLSVIVLVAVLALAVGCARIAHEHENSSTPLRVTVAVISVVMLGWALGIYFQGTGAPAELLWVMPAMTQAIVILPFLFFVTEAEPLGRRTVKQVPKSRLLALLSTPFLPGGARGLLLYTVTAVVTWGAIAVGLAFAGSFRSMGGALTSTSSALDVLAAMFAYGFVVLGLLSGIASFHIRSLRGRTGVRVAIPLALVLACIVPTVLGFLFDDRDWGRFEHPFNLFWTLERLESHKASQVTGALVILVVAVIATVAVNVPRVWRAVAETLAASRARRQRESADQSVA